jgi:hypothetical protein
MIHKLKTALDQIPIRWRKVKFGEAERQLRLLSRVFFKTKTDFRCQFKHCSYRQKDLADILYFEHSCCEICIWKTVVDDFDKTLLGFLSTLEIFKAVKDV